MIPEFYEYSVSSGELDVILSPDKSFALQAVRVHAGKIIEPTGTLRVDRVAASGRIYDDELINESLSGETSYSQTFNPMHYCRSGDSLRFQLPNTTENSYGLTAIWFRF